MKKRIYAEWEKQDGILLAFPHKDSDWKTYLQEAREVYSEIIYHILRLETCILICQDKQECEEYLTRHFRLKKWDLKVFKNLYILEIPTNDTWARDFGGITICKNNKNIVFDYGFNGWGLKFTANFDNTITKKLGALNIFNKIKTKSLILEGGSIESNGEGILLSNTQCLLESNRNPSYSLKKLSKKLKKDLGIKKILWLHHGFLEGDDTDSHIDTLARFITPNTIVYLKCENKRDKHYDDLAKMEKELQNLKNLNKKPFHLIPLPFCTPKYYNNERLPATYANFLFLNDSILFPIYQDKNDKRAIEIMQKALPHHKIIPIDCSVLIRQHGSLHCISMQFPYKTLNYNALLPFKFLYQN
ncbi:MAG: agmatine deiminase family protein [Helicobacter sp.]|nr:agmatine deiminase family protein [Helicobacter sp.]